MLNKQFKKDKERAKRQDEMQSYKEYQIEEKHEKQHGAKVRREAELRRFNERKQAEWSKSEKKMKRAEAILKEKQSTMRNDHLT